MRKNLLLGFILFAALFARLAFVWHFYSHPHPANILDADGYTHLAASLVEKGQFLDETGVLSLDRPPGFPIFISVFYVLFGEKPLLVLFLNVLLSTATCGLAYALGRRLFSPRVGLLALAFWAIYPYSIYYCGWAIRESFITFLVAGELWCLLEWYEKRTPGWAAVCGAVGAAIGLTNPVSLILLGLTPLTLLVSERFRSAARHAVFYYAVLGVLYSPWPIRNYFAFGSPILTNVHGGKQLYQGILVPPEAFGTEDETKILNADPDYRHGLDMYERHDYFAANRWFNGVARRWVLRHPVRYASIVAYRVVKLWRLVPYERTYSHDYRKIFWASLLSDGIVIPLGLLGILAFRKRWREFLPLYSALGLWTLAYVLVFVVIRFRLPVMMVMILFAAAEIDRFLPQARPS